MPILGAANRPLQQHTIGWLAFLPKSKISLPLSPVAQCWLGRSYDSPPQPHLKLVALHVLFELTMGCVVMSHAHHQHEAAHSSPPERGRVQRTNPTQKSETLVDPETTLFIACEKKTHLLRHPTHACTHGQTRNSHTQNKSINKKYSTQNPPPPSLPPSSPHTTIYSQQRVRVRTTGIDENIVYRTDCVCRRV